MFHVLPLVLWQPCCSPEASWVMPILLSTPDCTPNSPGLSCIALLLQAHIGDIDNIKGCLPYARINKQKAARK